MHETKYEFMINLFKVASYLYQRYKEEFGVCIDEMKLHKLLYFTQRESIVQTGEPMFTDEFEAWKYGPVMVAIRDAYKNEALDFSLSEEELQDNKDTFDMVFKTYAPSKSWSLSDLTHGEYSWQKAREGYDDYDSCSVKMKTDDIRKDAHRIKTRRIICKALNSKSA